MKPEIKEKWIKALKSGEYQQGTGRLRTYDGKFCCLGVLCDLYQKETGHGHWLKEDDGDISFLSCICYLPNEVGDWAIVPDYGGYYDNEIKRKNSLSNLNDTGCTFEEIADVIQKEF